MITKEIDQQGLTPSQIRKLGDYAILFGMIDSKLFHDVLFKSKEAFWQIFRQISGFHVGVTAYCLIGVTRCRFGIQATGVILTSSALSLLTFYNSSYVWPVFKPLGVFATPVLAVYWDWEDFRQHMLVEIHSEALQIYTMVLAVTSLVHVVMAYTGFGNVKLSKRGESWIYTILVWMFPRNAMIRKTEFLICVFIEPSITIGAGFLSWYHFGDVYFGAFLITAGAVELVIQLADKAFQLKVQSVINA